MSAQVVAIVDSGPLVAIADRSDPEHLRSLRALALPSIRYVIPALVVAEVSYLIGQRLGPTAESGFLAGLGEASILPPDPEDWQRIADLVERYPDFPLGGIDASVVTLTERLNTDLIVTLDRRHFAAVRPRHVSAFRLLPD